MSDWIKMRDDLKKTLVIIEDMPDELEPHTDMYVSEAYNLLDDALNNVLEVIAFHDEADAPEPANPLRAKVVARGDEEDV